MRLIISYGLLFVCSNIFAQDSLRLVPVRAWMLSRMVDEVRIGRSCDSAFTRLSAAFTTQKRAYTAQTDLLREVEFSRNQWKEKSFLQDSLQLKDSELKAIEVKSEKRKGRIKVLAGIGIGVLIGVLLL